MSVGLELGVVMAEVPDTPSFDAYMSARWSRLVRSAILLGCDPHTAEDVVQTTFARCYFAWTKVTGARDPDAYVHRILINTIAETKRRRWAREHPTPAPAEQEQPDQTDQVDQSRGLLAALQALPEIQRQVIVLRFYADFSEAQTADALGIPVGTVKSRASRALATLAANPDLSPTEWGPRQ